MKSITIHLLTFGLMVSGLTVVHSSEKKLDPRLEDTDLVLSKKYVMNVSMTSFAEDEQRRKAKAKEESEYAEQLRKAMEESAFDEAVRESLILSRSSVSLTGSSSDLPLSSTVVGETTTTIAAKIEEDEAIPREIREESIRVERDRQINVLRAERDALSDAASSLYTVSSDLSQQIMNLYAQNRPQVERSSILLIPSSALSQSQAGQADSMSVLSSDDLNITSKSRTPSFVAGSLSSTTSEQKSDASESSISDSFVVKK